MAGNSSKSKSNNNVKQLAITLWCSNSQIKPFSLSIALILLINASKLFLNFLSANPTSTRNAVHKIETYMPTGEGTSP